MNDEEEARAEVQRRWGTMKENPEILLVAGGFMTGAEWQASRDAAKVEHLRDVITRAHHESMATDLRSATVLAVVRGILAEGTRE